MPGMFLTFTESSGRVVAVFRLKTNKSKHEVPHLSTVILTCLRDVCSRPSLCQTTW